MPFPIAVVCVHLKALKIASKMGFFFPFLPWSSFTCSATHLGAHYLHPSSCPFPAWKVGCPDLSNPQGIVQTLINLSSVL